MTVLWGEQPNSAKPAVERHRQVEIRATVAPAPYVREVRDPTARPDQPARCYELAPMTWKSWLTKMWWGQLTPM